MELNKLYDVATKELYEQGNQYSYEFAEELGVSENLINKAYNYYKENSYI